MQASALNTQTATTPSVKGNAARTPFLLRLLTWLARADASYRQKRKLTEMPDHLLTDMGMTRADAATAFRKPR